jgi:hypothetical protein
VANDCARYEVKTPRMQWWRDESLAGDITTDGSWRVVGSYEHAPYKCLTVCDVGDRVETKINLIHELAHHIASQLEGADNHEPAFWKICWSLYFRHRIPLARAIYSEFSYLAGAEKVLREMGVRLKKEDEVAAALGAATRRQKWLSTQIRRLKARLEMTSRKREEKAIKGQVRELRVRHKANGLLVAKTMRVYKRKVMKRK